MKKTYSIIIGLTISLISKAQLSMHGSIQQGEKANSVNIIYMPAYTSNPGEYVNYLSISVAIPDLSANHITPSIKGVGIFSTMLFTEAIPFSYTKGRERIYSWICVNPGPTEMFWTRGNSFVGAAITFTASKEITGLDKVKLVDFSNTSDLNDENISFSISTNRTNDATDHNDFFYSISGKKGGKTGTYDNMNQFAEVNLQSEEQHIQSEQKSVVIGKSSKPLMFSISALFPNPARAEVSIIIDAPRRDNVTLVVSDIYGKTVKQRAANVETGSNTIPVDISALAKGSYLVKVVCKSSDCEGAVSKFVKQ